MYNLKNIMELLVGISDGDKTKIKEYLFLLLGFFILTYEYRQTTI